MLKSPLTHRCSLACVCFALIQYSPSSSRCWVSAGDGFTTWMGERRVWMAPNLLTRVVLLLKTMNELCNTTNIFEHHSIHYSHHCPHLFGSCWWSFCAVASCLLVEGSVQSPSNYFYKGSMKKVKSLCYESKYSDQCRNKSIGWWCLWVRWDSPPCC